MELRIKIEAMQIHGFRFIIVKVTTGFEPVIRELQSHALPLGYVT